MGSRDLLLVEAIQQLRNTSYYQMYSVDDHNITERLHCACTSELASKLQSAQLPCARAASYSFCSIPTHPERVYVMDDAVVEAPDATAADAPMPAPPCVVLLDTGAGVRVDIDDRAAEAAIIAIRADDVLVATAASVANEKCNAELLDFFARALAVRRSTLSVRLQSRRATGDVVVCRSALWSMRFIDFCALCALLGYQAT